jgi:hypothetical protein
MFFARRIPFAFPFGLANGIHGFAQALCRLRFRLALQGCLGFGEQLGVNAERHLAIWTVGKLWQHIALGNVCMH